MLTDAPPPSARSSRSSEAPDGERHIVSVTFSMKMTNFATTPAHTKPLPQEKSDRTPPPPAPTGATGDPDGQHTDTLTPSQPSDPPPNKPTPDTKATAELILQELLSTPKPINTQPQPLAPLPQAAEQLDQPTPIQPRLARTDPQADPLDNLLPDISQQLEQSEQASEQQPDELATDAQPIQPTPEPTPKPAEPVEPTEQTPPNEAEPTPPPSADAVASDDVDDEPDDRPAAKVYDEDSVDQPIAFDKMKRPKATIVSKRLGEKGTVRILIEVDATGKLIRHEVIDDAGYARLLKAALAALKDSTFLPAEHQGNPVSSTRIIEYQF